MVYLASWTVINKPSSQAFELVVNHQLQIFFTFIIIFMNNITFIGDKTLWNFYKLIPKMYDFQEV